jgi:hypothetical protein
MRKKLLGALTASVAVAGLAAMAPPAQAQTVVARTVSLRNTAVTVVLKQAVAGTVAVSETCTPANGETFTVGLKSSGGVVAGAPKQLPCDGNRHTVSWAHVPAGTDTFTLAKSKPSSTTLRITLQIGLPSAASASIAQPDGNKWT